MKHHGLRILSACPVAGTRSFCKPKASSLSRAGSTSKAKPPAN